MGKDSRSGGKFSGSHTSLISAAVIVADIAAKCPFVTNISPGFIKSGLKSVNGKRRVKIIDDGSSILLSVSGNISCQEIRVYSDDFQATKVTIARAALDAGLSISFGKR